MIRNRTRYISIAITFCVAVAGLWFFRDEGSIATFVENWSLSFEKAEQQCRTSEGLKVLDCAHWAVHAPIYDSSQFAELERWLTPACQQGGWVECQRLQKIASARQENTSPWLSATEADAPINIWPHIKSSEVPLSSSEWLYNALQGAIAGSQTRVDLFCGNLTEINETLVCTSSNQIKLNLFIGRVVAYIEQNRRLDSYQNHAKNPINRFWQGVDLQREDFNSAVKVLRQLGALAPEEDRLWSWLETKSWQVFLAFNMYSVFTGIPSHEFLHALYFSSEEFRGAARSVLENRNIRLEKLSQFIDLLYKTPDGFIISNEKQAYLFEHNSSYLNGEGRRVIAQILNALPMNFDQTLIDKLRQGY
ncbi:MAG: hypothetical protein RJB13_2563 [Pseudomonadota bacterium]|jgi:hypothetical protein